MARTNGRSAVDEVLGITEQRARALASKNPEIDLMAYKPPRPLTPEEVADREMRKAAAYKADRRRAFLGDELPYVLAGVYLAAVVIVGALLAG